MPGKHQPEKHKPVKRKNGDGERPEDRLLARYHDGELDPAEAVQSTLR